MSNEVKPAVRPDMNNPVVRSGALIPMFPIGDRVVVERLDPQEEELPSGIIVPGVDKEKSLYCTVIAAGPVALDILRDACISIGDTVCIGKYSGNCWEWKPPGSGRYERVDIINAKDVLGSAELAQKVADGRIGLGLHKEADGVHRHRFLEEVEREAA